MTMGQATSPSRRQVYWRRQQPQRPPLSARISAALKHWAYLTLLGALLGVMVHIVTILAAPSLATQDAVTRFSDIGLEGKAELINPSEDPARPVVDHDPATAVAVCGFDLSDGPYRVSARTGALPLGLSIHRRGGGVAYAITDRAAIRGLLEFVVLTERQLAERIAGEDDGGAQRELRVVVNSQQGLVVARALAKRSSDRAEAEALVGGVACGPAE